MNEPAQEDALWVEKHVKRFQEVRPVFQAFAETLEQVLKKAAGKLAPLAIIQARAKGIPSFAEKIIRKRHLYLDPLVDMTDLCGGRVIAHTADQVHAVCRYIEESFEIDWDNSDDVSQRLRPTEFGYRSVHYIVTFKPDVFPNRMVPVRIPPELLAGLPKRLFDEPDPPHHPIKAEIQVRTILEHAWADIGHDMTYKSGLKVPPRFLREFAAIAAVLEGTDREFARIHHSLQTYASEYGKYLKPEEIGQEIQKLDLVLRYDPENAELATRIATLASAIGQWEKAIQTLAPYVSSDLSSEPPNGSLRRSPAAVPAGKSSDFQPALRVLGIAMCRQNEHQPSSQGFLAGRELLQAATKPPHKDPEGLCALADTWRTEDEDQARMLYRQAFELDPSHPVCLANYLEYEILCQRSGAIVPLVAPTIVGACGRCRNQIEAGVNLPWAYLHLAKFHLLLGQPYESLAALAKTIQLSTAPFMLQAALDSLKRLKVIADKLPGYDWVFRLLVVGQAARYPKELPGAQARVRELASRGCPPIRGPVVIVAGGCDRSVEQQMHSYRQLLLEAFREFTGTIVSGGTTQGISGLVGDLRQHHGSRLHTIGYVPRLVPADATVDTNPDRYDEVRRSEGAGFSAMEPLQNWLDLLSAGIAPADVKVLGINGGTIAGAEYRMAAALGARVVLIEKSGREAAKVFTDPDWEGSANLISMPADAMTVRAFIGYGEPKLSKETCETIAKGIHEAFRRNKAKTQSADASLADWDALAPTLKNSNRHQANHIFEKLREIGRDVKPIGAGSAPEFQFTSAEIERLAEMEHGRWNVERLLDGWRWGEVKDIGRKISPYLVSWPELPEDVKHWDRAAVREIPALLAKVGLEIC